MVFNVSNFGATYIIALGGSTGSLGVSVQSTGVQFISVAAAIVYNCAATYNTGTNYAVAYTYDTSTKAISCYHLSGGSYSSAGGGTGSTVTYTTNITAISIAGGGSHLWNGVIAEEGLATGTIWGSTQLNQLAAYIYATYGL
jgi:hypothetical protein